ncbi:hypothetical protein PTTG_26698 [Puccinia triticina 1-1 BBBD Race 1]|uniref:Uncharacterized protein n=1 Tax=Puccinia triticina (isolate 1-1 / race 1 (BBBD)) TaxID=630390 RepID=A0A180GTH1_PUCT1|nr:hypothetical protein PTTG_26698 [Puccinia triticina 1-1 BBBD Race 1]
MDPPGPTMDPPTLTYGLPDTKNGLESSRIELDPRLVVETGLDVEMERRDEKTSVIDPLTPTSGLLDPKNGMASSRIDLNPQPDVQTETGDPESIHTIPAPPEQTFQSRDECYKSIQKWALEHG